jgi:[acyl-carrier-protein] S-malonyltransferase
MKYAFLYPGQGSQSVGMGKDLVLEFDCARRRFAEADAVLGRDLSRTILDGPLEELTKTQNTQPALFTMEAAITDILAEKGIVPSYAAGHSLGEYSALYAAGVIAFEDGIRLVAKRGELMAEAGAARPGTMAAVIGLEKDKIVGILKTVAAGIVVTANENEPNQTVISGEIRAVHEASEKIMEAGARKVIQLSVSGAFHSPLMQSAADSIAQVLETVNFKTPRCPIIANVTAKPETDPSYMKKLLIQQLISPVHWVDSMKTLAGFNPLNCIEAGPGSVLRGLARKCSDTLNVVAADTVTNISSLVQQATIV